MDITPIKSQRDYRRVLREIEGLMAARRNSREGDRLDVLVTLVEAWERKHYRLDLPDPVEAIRYHMEQNGLQPRDLIPFIGGRNRVHEVLNRRRELTINMIRRLHEGLGIPAESLIKIGRQRAAYAGAARVRLISGGVASSTSAATASAVGITF
jgi:HTH-type transcriptional regulator/antitoxin HigA